MTKVNRPDRAHWTIAPIRWRLGRQVRRAAALALAATLAVPALPLSDAQAQAPRKQAAATKPDPARRAKLLSGVRSWAYQLQNLDLGAAERAPFDVLVMDYSRNGSHDARYTPAEIRRLKRKPDGSRRLVLAYLSVGEAEDYRFYWNERWIETATPDSPATPTTPADPAPTAAAPGSPPAAVPPVAAATPPIAAVPPTAPQPGPQTPPLKPDRWLSPLAPPWLGDENEHWSGNFQVKYWEPEWQALLFGAPGAYLDRILAQGFDGIYLDRVDAYYEFEDQRPSAAADMVALVQKLAAHARRLVPDALVVAQNGEELLLVPPFLEAIDAIAKEDLFYGSPAEGQPNSPGQIANSLRWLSNATRAGRRVLVVEYLDDPAAMSTARTALEREGFVPYFAPRSLDALRLPVAAPGSATGGPAKGDSQKRR